jgi:hypothetical protein
VRGRGVLVGQGIKVPGVDAAPVVNRQVRDVGAGAIRGEGLAGPGVDVDVVVDGARAVVGEVEDVNLPRAVDGEVKVGPGRNQPARELVLISAEVADADSAQTRRIIRTRAITKPRIRPGTTAAIHITRKSR